MYDAVLFPTDGSDAAESALSVAVAAADAHDATLHLLYVADTNRPSLTNVRGTVRDVLERRGQEVLDGAERAARTAGVDTVTEVVQGGPSRTILSYVDERGVDLVAMGARGERDLGTAVLGSVTDRVLRDSPVPVLTVAPEAGDSEYPPGDVLVGTDGSDGAAAAVEAGAHVAAATGARLHLVAVDEADLLGFDLSTATGDDGRADRLSARLDEAAERAAETGAGAVETAVVAGAVSDALGEYADANGVDLVVLGASGRAAIGRRVLGSTAERTVRTAAVPVVTVPETD